MIRHLARALVGIGLAAAVHAHGAAAGAAWQPRPDQRFDIQLTPPYDLARAVDVLVLEPFATAPGLVGELHAQGVAVVCHLTAGRWQGWRPDAATVPAPALGRAAAGPRERWLDIRDRAVADLMGARLDLCRGRGFDGVLFADLDGYAAATGFPLTAGQQLAFNQGLAAAAHARGLAAGIVNDLAQAPQLAPVFDFAVADRCVAGGDCAGVQPFLAAGKPAYLIGYTNRPAQMDAYCATAAAVGAPLILKTMSLNGKLHRRCAERPAPVQAIAAKPPEPSSPPKAQRPLERLTAREPSGPWPPTLERLTAREPSGPWPPTLERLAAPEPSGPWPPRLERLELAELTP